MKRSVSLLMARMNYAKINNLTLNTKLKNAESISRKATACMGKDAILFTRRLAVRSRQEKPIHSFKRWRQKLGFSLAFFLCSTFPERLINDYIIAFLIIFYFYSTRALLIHFLTLICSKKYTKTIISPFARLGDLDAKSYGSTVYLDAGQYI